MPLIELRVTASPTPTSSAPRSHDGFSGAHSRYARKTAPAAGRFTMPEPQHPDAGWGERATAATGSPTQKHGQPPHDAPQMPELHVRWNEQSAARVHAQRRESARLLELLADELLVEAAGHESLQATRVLPRSISGLRQTLIAVAGAAVLDSHAAHVEGSLHMLRGTARHVADGACTELQTNDDALLPVGAHAIHADAGAVILQSVVVTRKSHQTRATTPSPIEAEQSSGLEYERSEAPA